MFITFEGPEGAGKSTAIRHVAEELRARGHSVMTTREPGAGSLGGQIRALLLHGDAIDPRAELFLFLADRAQHVATIVRPALDAGSVVLCDRHADSTLVYQGLVRGLSADFVRAANAFATTGLTPALTLLFDLPAEVGLSRLTSPDRLDREPIEFHRAVREGFQKLAAEEPGRWRVIDASETPARVAEGALAACLNAIQQKS